MNSGNRLLLIFGLLALLSDDVFAQDSLNMSTVSWLHMSGAQGWHLTLNSSYAYVAEGNGGLKIIDVSTPANPQIVSTISTGFTGQTALVGESYLIFTNDPGFRVANISNPSNPTYTNQMSTATIEQIITVGNTVYMACRSSGVLVWNFTTPMNPTMQTSLATRGLARGLKVAGNRLFVGEDNFVEVFDITNPSSPMLLTTINSTGIARKVDVFGNRLYVANYYSGLRIFDITSLSAVQQIGSWMGYSACDVMYADSLIYIADSYNGVVVLNVDNPAAPVMVGHYRNIPVVNIVAQNHLVYVADYYGGLAIFRYGVTTPPPIGFGLNHPNGGERLLLGAVDTIRWNPGSVSGPVTIKINYNYPDGDWETIANFSPNTGSDVWIVSGATTTHARMKIVSVWDNAVMDVSNADFTIARNNDNSAAPEGILPKGTNLTLAYPNPFNSSVSIIISSVIPSRCSVQIYNSNGQLISKLFEGAVRSGESVLKWSPTSLPSGSYYALIKTDQRIETKRLLYVK